MIFSSIPFVIFFAVVLGVHWGLGLLPTGRERIQQLRVLFLLGASYCFYASWNAYLLSLIVFSTLVDFEVGRRLDRTEDRAGRKRLLFISCATNLGLLGIFKYTNFFIGSFQDLLRALGVQSDPVLLHIVLPVGISFYTFQSMSYTLDIFRGKLRHEPSFIRFAMFVAFFPQLVAGPIVRATEFLWQIRRDHRLVHIDLDFAAERILGGFVKKMLVADMIAPFVDDFFANPTAYGTAMSWVGSIAYTVQLYCDFSGYSDIAIGCAALLGYRLPRNFDFPYAARNVADLWGRWHITLSTWMRDYLFMALRPRGRKGRKRSRRAGEWHTLGAMFMTMLLSGLWHGAAYNFVAWGALHGLLFAGHRAIADRWRALTRPLGRRVNIFLGILITYLFWNITTVLFRSPQIGTAGTILWRMFTPHPDAAFNVPAYVMLACVATLAFHYWGEFTRQRPPHGALNTAFIWLRPLRYAAMLILLILASESHEQPFIYFQF